MRILLTVEYDGENFCGWQVQPGKRTVQGVLEEALGLVLGERPSLHASGRTDAGVHAENQKAHFDTGADFPIERLPLAVNTKLPPDVSVKMAEGVREDFEAQYLAKEKTYEYSFYLSKIPRPLVDKYAARVPYDERKFDEQKAKNALLKIVGKHDFLAFSSTGRPVKNSTRTIFFAHMRKENGIFRIAVSGDGFLYNMVRIIVGTVVEIGLGLLPEGNIEKAFTTKDRTLCGKTFPPNGLVLKEVTYLE